MMKATVAIAGILSATALVVLSQQVKIGEFHPDALSLANTEAENKILAVLDEMVRSQSDIPQCSDAGRENVTSACGDGCRQGCG
jgi:hypothetical protein